MKRLLRSLALIGCLLLQMPAHSAAPEPAADVFAHPATITALRVALTPATRPLQGAQSIRGAYRQQKQLHELPRPLSSSGRFLFLRDTGIAWTTIEPFASELVITREHLIQREGDNEVLVSAAQQPALQMVAEIFFAVFSLDFDTLESLFDLYGGANADGSWSLGLRPKQAAGSVVGIQINGAAQVEQVLLTESSGDLTRIDLQQVQISQDAPDAADRALFSSPPKHP
ncbi:outer membrane lipoprotein carrier protein LolA [Sinimarinibacterium sp. CAU 1509]|uniref:outer membrane lipoprotein carrier protein LolA n=1 Tax=Sinimarinibacterium sp. CAU 1509 TaxID=2562283 RepID=UPI0010AB760F|nr:outer membrane lipoprotein carrier protein LolA [Sinimarinibacterium sp. CAU 1509]TJY58291.1 outer membrane lipoprotein carrier protein LolA [Sinimarinibacterium sp. CAU 1509]